ncbi:hypothetical protein AAG747_26915 [Rapidithrix thailandica]|uniref:Lipoprotein n=1 Tax=Rapidithrix thailandica TaxID=413964 RepID=A0AAW9S8Q9_9BACT
MKLNVFILLLVAMTLFAACGKRKNEVHHYPSSSKSDTLYYPPDTLSQVICDTLINNTAIKVVEIPSGSEFLFRKPEPDVIYAYRALKYRITIDSGDSWNFTKNKLYDILGNEVNSSVFNSFWFESIKGDSVNFRMTVGEPDTDDIHLVELSLIKQPSRNWTEVIKLLSIEE